MRTNKFCSDTNQFTRDGHYRRSLETGWGQMDVLRVPMLECQRCEHDVVAQFAIMEKYQRFWLDAPQAATVGASVGLRTINERINQLEAGLAQVHREPISEVLAVVQFDGIWLSSPAQIILHSFWAAASAPSRRSKVISIQTPDSIPQLAS